MTLNEQRAVARLSATAPRRQYEHKSTWDRRNRRRSNFVARVRITPEGCWTWQGHAVTRNSRPYAVVSHRESATGGKPVQRGAFNWMIDEFFPELAPLFRRRTAPGCDRSLCLNPWHRVDRRVTRASVNAGTVREVYAARDSGESAQVVADRYGVSTGWVQSVWAGRSWRSVTGAPLPAPQKRRYTDAERRRVAKLFGTGSLRQVAREAEVHYKFVQAVWADLRNQQTV